MSQHNTNTRDLLIEKIINFIKEIGLNVEFAEVPDKTILPGILVKGKTIVVDDAKLKYPGDLLHEAGHLAVIPPSRREQTTPDVGNQPAEEMMAIAWSYAALLHLGLEPEIVFHEHGYKGGSESIIENFSNGYYFGVPMLQYLGMSYEPNRVEGDAKPFPAMQSWLCQ